MDMTIILYAGAALAIVMLIIGLIVSLTSDRTMVEERLGRYVEADQPVIGRQAVEFHCYRLVQ